MATHIQQLVIHRSDDVAGDPHALDVGHPGLDKVEVVVVSPCHDEVPILDDLANHLPVVATKVCVPVQMPVLGKSPADARLCQL